MKRSRTLAAAALSTLLTVAACGGGGQSATPEGEAPTGGEACTAELAGGKITMGVGQATQTLDPVTQNSGGNGGSERAALYDTLMTYDPGTNTYAPHLAESLASNEDATEWTLKLRAGITFPTGNPLTADVVRQSLERHSADASTSNIVNILEFVEELEVVDELTLKFHLSEPYGTLPFLLAGSGGEITNPEVVKQLGDKFGQQATPAMGLGPYDLERFAPGEEVVLKAKKDYWGGPVCIDEIRFVYITGGQPTYEALKLGEVQMAYLTDARAVDLAKRDGVAGYSSNSFAGAAVLMNNGVRGGKPATIDPKVREAITLAVDPEVMNKRRWDGLGAASTSLVYPPESPLASDVSGPKPDPERAKELVAEAKAGGWNGKLNLVCPNDPSNQEAAIALKALLYSVGIDVEASNVATADLIKAVIVDADYDLACWGVGAQPASPYLAFSGFHSESTSNYSGFANPEMDEAIDALQAAQSSEQQREAIGAIQTVWNAAFPAVVYGSPESYIAVDDSLRGTIQTSWGTVLFHKAFVK
ncbi:ABC transporter substrate-binding protein [Nocardioides daejeonensis]|uniref:ABC transporter substrate-binding protein n=1 Tax=Nocardioides daejeonensis TaxID=1046556 RepID=UPI0013A5BBAC|nr:ABC transporter substrate-binding protein [Nocardioides daejeonensis]